MSDLDTMRDMLSRAGISFSENVSGFKNSERNPECVVLVIECGYPGFYTSLSFRKDGEGLHEIAARE